MWQQPFCKNTLRDGVCSSAASDTAQQVEATHAAKPGCALEIPFAQQQTTPFADMCGSAASKTAKS
jgi:hypothetical protein